MPRQRVLSGTIWEERNGYARAVRTGDHVFVSGTIAVDDEGDIVNPDAPYLQAKFCLEKIERALEQLGASRRDVVVTRIYVTNIGHEQEVGKAHLDFFGDVMPCCTMVQISRLASSMALVEIEAQALIGSAPSA